ncbi:MAG: FkbM family methyltransferase [Oscillospiraceae bacterium]|jgi:FkbM family methyltransferase|nr:FkbM family methyltransferase [Oscillospiraceae bacterium]
MNVIDRNFSELVQEIHSLSEKELYYRIRRDFDRVPAETRKSCQDFFNRFGYWGRLDPQQGIFEQIELKELALFEHIGEYAWLYERLEDYRSKKTLYSILSNWYRYDFTSTAQTKEYMYDDYFDLDVVSCTPEEVVVDLGAYTGDTVKSYIRNYGEDCYRRIYCYEITPDSFGKLQKNLAGLRDIELRLKGVADMPGRLSLSPNEYASANRLLPDSEGEVEVTTLDLDIEEPVTLIKADIEGMEQRALAGARGHILNDHPKLLISVYHSNEDLWRIPQIIHEISRDYRFYLRYRGSPIYPTEISLLAV